MLSFKIKGSASIFLIKFSSDDFLKRTSPVSGSINLCKAVNLSGERSSLEANNILF